MNSSATSKGPRRPWILSPAHAMPGVDRMSPKAYAATHHPTLDPTDVMGYPSSSSRKGMTGTMSPYPERSTRSPTATAKEMKAVEDRRRRKIGGEGRGRATTNFSSELERVDCIVYRYSLRRVRRGGRRRVREEGEERRSTCRAACQRKSSHCYVRLLLRTPMSGGREKSVVRPAKLQQPERS